MKNILLGIILVLFGAASVLAQDRLYVHHAATGANDGTSWADAFNDLQAALQLADAGDEVWVAEGVYYPTQTTDRHISFEPKSGVRLYGGFAGFESTIDQRDWMANVVMLSGDIGVAGDSTDNSLNVVYLWQSDSNTVLDGFTLCFGRADDEPAAGSARDRVICGGGLYIEAGNWDALPNILNCKFWRNSALAFGGAVMTNGASNAGVAPRFVNCRFEENYTAGSGGGLARFGGSWKERGHELEACSFKHNFAALRGGGLFYSDTQGPNKVSVETCVFEKNHAEISGGGMYLLTGKTGISGLNIQQCVFEANYAQDAAAIRIFANGNFFDGELAISGCRFVRHKSVQGQTIESLISTDQISNLPSTLTLSGTIFEDNIVSEKIVLWSWAFADLLMEYLIFEQNFAGNLFQQGDLKTSNLNYSVFSSNECTVIGNYVVPTGSISNCLFRDNKTTNSSGLFIAINTKRFDILNSTFLYERRPGNIYEGFIRPESDTFLMSNTIITDSLTKWSILANFLSNNSFGFFDCNDQFPEVICGPGNLSGLDPLFRDTANGDFSLLPCSPLINSGSNLAAAGILTDLAGNPRIQGGTVDIGAYESPAFALSGTPQVQPACLGASNGSISLQPENGCTPLVYQWSPNVGSGPELDSLAPGLYVLTLTDGSGQQITNQFVVETAPSPALALAAQDIACGTVAGGTLSASVQGGTAPFEYLWSPAAADTPLLTQQQPGFYALTIVDANGCQDSATAAIALMGQITLTIGGQIIPCHGETGWLSATPSTGAAPFTWHWDGWPGTDPVAEPLGPGQYSVTVTDAYGCTAANTYPPMTEPGPLSVGTGSSDQTQSNPPNGAAVVTTISGGTGPFGYLWEPGGGTTQAIAGLLAGTYTVTVTDKNGCSISTELIVQLMVSSTDPTPEAGVIIYPNPATDWLRVLLPAAQSSTSWHLELSDVSGRVLRSQGCASGDCVLDLSGMASGPYVVSARSGERVFVGKVVRR